LHEGKDVGQELAVRVHELLTRQVFCGSPCHFLVLEEPGPREGLDFNEPGREHTVYSPVREDGLAEESDRVHPDFELLQKLADNSFFIALVRFDLAAGEFPTTAEAANRASLGNEDLPLVDENPGY